MKCLDKKVKDYQQSAKEVLETADVMKQWNNPCVRDAQIKWMYRYEKAPN